MFRAALMIVLTILISAQLLYADNLYVRGGEPEEDIAERTVGELNLTPEQRERIYQQQREYRQEQRDLNSKQRERRRILREELESPKLDPRRVEDVTEDIKDLEGRIFDNKVKNLMRMKEVLTPEQFEAISRGRQRIRRERSR